MGRLSTGSNGGLRPVILVEDSADDAELFLRAVRRCGVQNPVLFARDGMEALKMLLSPESHVEPALVLLDLKLPRVDGIEVLRRVRSDERGRRMPIVILSNSQEERDIVACYRLGANGYVVKPVDFGEFVEAMRAIHRYWLVLNQPPPVAVAKPEAI